MEELLKRLESSLYALDCVEKDYIRIVEQARKLSLENDEAKEFCKKLTNILSYLAMVTNQVKGITSPSKRTRPIKEVFVDNDYEKEVEEDVVDSVLKKLDEKLEDKPVEQKEVAPIHKETFTVTENGKTREGTKEEREQFDKTMDEMNKRMLEMEKRFSEMKNTLAKEWNNPFKFGLMTRNPFLS